jgi:hypothetical protein
VPPFAEHVCSTFKRRLRQTAAACLKCANRRLMRQHYYSIISPARATNAAGISRPRAIETANVKPHLTLRAKKHSSALTLR